MDERYPASRVVPITRGQRQVGVCTLAAPATRRPLVRRHQRVRMPLVHHMGSLRRADHRTRIMHRVSIHHPMRSHIPQRHSQVQTALTCRVRQVGMHRTFHHRAFHMQVVTQQPVTRHYTVPPRAVTQHRVVHLWVTLAGFQTSARPCMDMGLGTVVTSLKSRNLVAGLGLAHLRSRTIVTGSVTTDSLSLGGEVTLRKVTRMNGGGEIFERGSECA